MISLNILQKTEILSSLPDLILKDISETSNMFDFPKNSTVLLKGENSTDFLFLIKGQLIVMDHSINGQEIGLHVIAEGESFGELSVIDSQPRAASVVATKPSIVGFVPQKSIISAIKNYPELAVSLLAKFAAIIRSNNKRRVILSLDSIEKRIAAILLDESSINGKFTIHSQHKLAIMANTTRESVSRTLSKFSKCNIIEKNGKDIIIINIEELEKKCSPGGV